MAPKNPPGHLKPHQPQPIPGCHSPPRGGEVFGGSGGVWRPVGGGGGASPAQQGPKGPPDGLRNTRSEPRKTRKNRTPERQGPSGDLQESQVPFPGGMERFGGVWRPFRGVDGRGRRFGASPGTNFRPNRLPRFGTREPEKFFPVSNSKKFLYLTYVGTLRA